MNRKKYSQSISGRKKILAVCILLFFFAPALSLAADEAQNAGDPSYYLLSVYWDSESNVLSLNGDVALTSQNLLKDTGSGSQFYARVINFNNKAKVFQSGDTKMFLGKWETKGDVKKVEMKITVPYFSDGQKVVIFDAKEKKTKLVVNVVKFAKIQKAAQSAQTKNASASAQSNVPQTYLIGGHTAAYWWTMRIIILLLLGGGGYFIWRWRKKKKMVQMGSSSNLVKK